MLEFAQSIQQFLGQNTQISDRCGFVQRFSFEITLNLLRHVRRFLSDLVPDDPAIILSVHRHPVLMFFGVPFSDRGDLVLIRGKPKGNGLGRVRCGKQSAAEENERFAGEKKASNRLTSDRYDRPSLVECIRSGRIPIRRV